MKVLIVQGGFSNERTVSLRSAANVSSQLQLSGVEVMLADPCDADYQDIISRRDYDLVFPLLHGAGGEDGELQRKLDISGGAYVGSGASACALTYNKAEYRDKIAENDVHVARGEMVDRASFEVSALRRRPYVLKPVDGGSSIDTLILSDISDEPSEAYFNDLFANYSQMLLEEYIAGQEITVGVLGGEALPIILITPPEGQAFDYENKYNGASNEVVAPSEIPAALQERAQALALKVHDITGCRHMSRTDMIITPSGELVVLETNTIPGMTEQSLYPKMAHAAGYDMSALCDKLIKMAIA